MRISLQGGEVLVFAGLAVVMAFLEFDCGEQNGKIGLTLFVVMPKIGKEVGSENRVQKPARKAKREK